MKEKQFEVGDRVIKAKRYSHDRYCKHGGEEDKVPIGSVGVIKTIENDTDIEVKFDNDTLWTLDISELKFEKKGLKKAKVKPDNMKRFMVYGTGCDNKSELFKTEKELKAEMREVAKDEDWKGRIIGYKLTPIFEAENKTILKTFKVKK